jgi:uncharacterized protein YukE
MADEIFMDVLRVKGMATQFNEMNDRLKQTSQVMQAAITLLKASAFIGMVGNQALASYLEQLKPQIDNYATKCGELSGDLSKSAEAYEHGDAAGATRFH